MYKNRIFALLTEIHINIRGGTIIKDNSLHSSPNKKIYSMKYISTVVANLMFHIYIKRSLLTANARHLGIHTHTHTHTHVHNTHLREHLKKMGQLLHTNLKHLNFTGVHISVASTSISIASFCVSEQKSKPLLTVSIYVH